MQCAHFISWRLIIYPDDDDVISIGIDCFTVSPTNEESYRHPCSEITSFAQVSVFFTPTCQFAVTWGHNVYMVQYGTMSIIADNRSISTYVVSDRCPPWWAMWGLRDFLYEYVGVNLVYESHIDVLTLGHSRQSYPKTYWLGLSEYIHWCV